MSTIGIIVVCAAGLVVLIGLWYVAKRVGLIGWAEDKAKKQDTKGEGK